MARKKAASRRRKREPGLEVSPAFRKPPPTLAVDDVPPDIPIKAIPVLRKKPVVIGPERAPRGARKPPAPPVMRTSPIAAALRKRAAESDGRPKHVDREVRLPADPVGLQRLQSSQPAATWSQDEGHSGLRPPRPRRARGLGLVGLFGTFLVLLAVAGIVVNASLPWLVVHPEHHVGMPVAPNLGAGTLSRADLAEERGVNPYFDRLVGWPMVAYTFLIFVGLLLAGIDELNNVTVASHRLMQVLLLAFSAFLGFVVALTGTRWFGLYVNAILDEGPTPLHLHVAPYLNLVLGAAIFAASTHLVLRRWSRIRLEQSRGHFAIEDIEVSKDLILGAAALLLLIPLLPFASVSSGAGTAYLGEAELAAARDVRSSGLDGIIASYGALRAMVWFALYGAGLGLLLAMLHRSHGSSAMLGAHVACLGVLALPLAIGSVSAIAFHIQIIAAHTRPSINLLPIVGYAGLGYIYAQYVRRILIPYARYARRNLPE